MSKKNKKLFNDLKEAMADAIAHQRGELELESRTFTIPEPPAEYKPPRLAALRLLEIVDRGSYNPPVVHSGRK